MHIMLIEVCKCVNIPREQNSHEKELYYSRISTVKILSKNLLALSVFLNENYKYQSSEGNVTFLATGNVVSNVQ
jgi:hypothetical protein